MKAVFIAAGLESFEEALHEIAGVSTERIDLAKLRSIQLEAADVQERSIGAPRAVEVEYEPSVLAFEKLLDVFWSHHDPQMPAGPDGDRHGRRRSVVMYFDDEQRIRAIMAKIQIDRSGRFERPIGTLILPAADLFGADHNRASQRLSHHEPLFGAPPGRKSEHPSTGEDCASP